MPRHSYILRHTDPELWRRVRVCAAREGLSLNRLILTLLTLWLEDREHDAQDSTSPVQKGAQS